MSTSNPIGGPGVPQHRNDNTGIVPASAGGSVPDPKESVEFGNTGIVPPWLQNPAPNPQAGHKTHLPTHPMNPLPNPVVHPPLNPIPNPDNSGDGAPPIIIRNPVPNHHNPSIPPPDSPIKEG